MLNFQSGRDISSLVSLIEIFSSSKCLCFLTVFSSVVDPCFTSLNLHLDLTSYFFDGSIGIVVFLRMNTWTKKVVDHLHQLHHVSTLHALDYLSY